MPASLRRHCFAAAAIFADAISPAADIFCRHIAADYRLRRRRFSPLAIHAFVTMPPPLITADRPPPPARFSCHFNSFLHCRLSPFSPGWFFADFRRLPFSIADTILMIRRLLSSPPRHYFRHFHCMPDWLISRMLFASFRLFLSSSFHFRHYQDTPFFSIVLFALLRRFDWYQPLFSSDCRAYAFADYIFIIIAFHAIFFTPHFHFRASIFLLFRCQPAFIMRFAFATPASTFRFSRFIARCIIFITAVLLFRCQLYFRPHFLHSLYFRFADLIFAFSRRCRMPPVSPFYRFYYAMISHFCTIRHSFSLMIFALRHRFSDWRPPHFATLAAGFFITPFRRHYCRFSADSFAMSADFHWLHISADYRSFFHCRPPLYASTLMIRLRRIFTPIRASLQAFRYQPMA